MGQSKTLYSYPGITRQTSVFFLLEQETSKTENEMALAWHNFGTILAQFC